MKKEIFIITVTFSTLLFFSCSKEKTAPQDLSIADQVTEGQKPGVPGPSLKGGLLARYEFNSNLQDFTGNLADAVSTTAGGEIYTTDRKGVPENAIRFVGRYGLNIFGVPAASVQMSVAAWVKYDSTNLNTNPFVNCFSVHPELGQDHNWYIGMITTPMTTSVSSGPIDDHWHHLVATYDGNTLKLYVDGVHVGNSVNPAGFGSYPAGFTTDYQVGFTTPQGGKDFSTVWYGSMDDLRFYGKVLSAKEVNALYSL
jgi:hypothetical protein